MKHFDVKLPVSHRAGVLCGVCGGARGGQVAAQVPNFRVPLAQRLFKGKLARCARRLLVRELRRCGLREQALPRRIGLRGRRRGLQTPILRVQLLRPLLDSLLVTAFTSA